MADRHAAARKAIEDAVLRGPGEMETHVRAALAAMKDAPDDLRALVEKIERAPYEVSDEDIRAMRARYSEDQIFEIVVAAALGASMRRLDAGLRALEEA